MNTRNISRLILSAMLGLMVAAPIALHAQQAIGTAPPILMINREYLKPGRAGTAHEKTESAYVAAAKAGKAPFHYLAMTSMSGPDRALFLAGYKDFKAMEDENKLLPDATGVALDHTMLADGDLLSATDSSIWRLQEDMSMNLPTAVMQRYMSFSLYTIKPGHDAEWAEAVKMIVAGYKKSIPEASWAMYSQVFGNSGNTYIVLNVYKSLGEIDEHHIGGKKFVDAMGKDGMKKIDELMAASVEKEQNNLFRFSPKMSLLSDEWINTEPTYWAPKSTAAKK